MFLLTSTSGGEGTSSLAVQPGALRRRRGTAGIGDRLQPELARLTLGFDAGSEPGMLGRLAGDRPLVHRVEAGFFFMAAGQARWQDAFAAASGSLACVLAVLRQTFDLIVIDGEPILTSAISSTIAPMSTASALPWRGGRENPCSMPP